MQPTNWNDISRYRGELFGLSIGGVMLLHALGWLRMGHPGGTFALLTRAYDGAIGSVGVDIFLFLSGFGIFYSLSSSPRAGGFYRKRFRRVLLPYLLVGAVYWFLRDIVLQHASWGTFCYDWSTLSFWGNGTKAYWYIALLCPLYLLAPWVGTRRPALILALMLASLLLSLLLARCAPRWFGETEIAWLRIPAFWTGMACAPWAMARKRIPAALLWASVLAVPLKLVLVLGDGPFARLANWPYSLFLVFLYLLARNSAIVPDCVGKALKTFGKYSLELFLVHIAVRDLALLAGLPATWAVCGGGMALSIVLAIALSRLFSARTSPGGTPQRRLS